METKKELKIFRKTSIEYLEKLYKKSVSYIFDKKTWLSTEADTYGKFRVLLRTRKSIKKLGNELNIFKFPTIVGLKIIYNKSMAFVFDKYYTEHEVIMATEENFLLRDISANKLTANDKELRIFKLPTVDNLKILYFKSIGKL